MTNDDINLREMGVPGSIFLRMKAEDTEFNNAIHRSFREMARVECKDDYTLALGKLLEYYQSDAKIESLWFALKQVEERLFQVEQQLNKPVITNDEDEEGDYF